MKKVFLGIIIGVAGIGIFASLQFFRNQQQLKTITSYADCVSAGFAVMETYPSQCRTSDGRTFTEYIGNELEYTNEILMESPRPNQKVVSPFIVQGKVRGNWLFEASFSGELFDADNKSLGIVVLTAKGEWMTSDFVPFSGELVFEPPTTKRGVLKIINANPSGLPENQKEIVIPVQFN